MDIEKAIDCLKADKEYLTDMKICGGEEMDVAIKALEKQKTMEIKSLINYEPFFNQYKPKDIVYPNAIARHFGISLKEAYNLCQNRVGKDLRTLYMVKCPVCGCALHGRYYSITSIDTEYEFGCNNCGTEFVVNPENDITVFFEKM